MRSLNTSLSSFILSKRILMKIILSICSILAIAAYTEAQDVLLKIPFKNEADLHALPWQQLIVRYEDSDFIIAEAGAAEQLYELDLPPYTILDYIEPDDRYYLVQIANAEQLAAIEEYGDVILRFRQSAAVVRGDVKDEASLLSLGLFISSLSNNYVSSPTLRQPIVPQVVKSASERMADSLIIEQLVNEVDPEHLRDTIYDLQENVDLDAPHTPFQSRFSLRVENTDNPSDDACDNAAEYIYRKFESYGLEVEYDLFDYEEQRQSAYIGNGVAGNYEMRNVIGTLPGSGINKDRIFIICAHYDSIAANSSAWSSRDRWQTMPAPGADDNASGTAGVIEAARVLSEADFGYTIKFMAFSGEEIWMLGSRHYADAASERGEEIIGVLNLDMIGHESGALDAAVMVNQSSAWLGSAAISARDAYNIDLEVRKYIDPSITNSDHAPFWSKRYSAFVISEVYYGNFGGSETSPVYHTTGDTVDKLNMDLVARITQVVLAAVAELADPANPDLLVLEDEIRISEDFPMPGQPVIVTVPIHNVGVGDAVDAEVEIWLEGPKRQDKKRIHQQTVDIEAGGTEEISVSVDLPEWGKYDVVVELNPDFTVFESDGANNTAEVDLDALPPDLSISRKDFRYSNDKLSMGHPVTLTVPVHNLGPGDFMDAQVRILLTSPSASEDEEPQIVSDQKVDIKANQSEEVSAILTLTELDWYELRVEVNPEYMKLEPEDSNNSIKQLIKASPPNLSIAASDLHLSDTSPDIGQQVTLTAQIRNNGTGNATGCSVQVWLLGASTGNVAQMVDEQTIDLEAKESHDISVQLSFTEWGEHEISVRINPDSAMYETDFDDNTAAKLISVSSATLEMVNFVIYPNPITFGNSKQLHIQYELSRDAGTTIEIYTISGKLVYQIEFASGETGGHTGLNDIPWPGENQVGERVASGVYICRIVVEDDQGAVEEKIKKVAILR